MEIWNIWTTLVESSIMLVYTQFGLSEAISIVVFTLAARMLLMPISFKAAYNMHKNKLALEKVKPEIERLKNVYKENPGELAKRTMAIYQKNGIKFIDKTTALNIGSQGILGVGIFQALNNMVFSSKFMWIANIAKPDVILALLVGVLTFLSMLMMPGAAEQSTLIIFIIPALISIFILASFPSAIGLYWATSNIVTMGQTLFLRFVISRDDKSAFKT